MSKMTETKTQKSERLKMEAAEAINRAWLNGTLWADEKKKKKGRRR